MFRGYYMPDIYYIILVVPAMFLALYAQGRVKNTFNKYSRVRNYRGYTGEQVARMILDGAGLYNVKIEPISGNLTDHYDPRTKIVRLSQSVYGNTSVASIGVAAHETGHAIQHQINYMPLSVRNSLVPIANLGSHAALPLAIIGLIFGFSPLIKIGIILFTAVVAFQLITLPVEFNASGRALKILETRGILSTEELVPTRKVLNAAALTYVAAAAVGAANLLRLILLSQRRRD